MTDNDRRAVQEFFDTVNSEIFAVRGKRKIFTSDKKIAGFFGAWYNDCKVNGDEVVFDENPVVGDNDIVIEISVLAKKKWSFSFGQDGNKYYIRICVPKNDQHEALCAMSETLIRYMAKVAK